MALHLLTCDCGGTIPVGPGRAGGEVPCPRCGKPLQVPKLRDLHALPLAPTSAIVDPKGRWGVPEAVLAAGVAVAVACLAVSSWLARPAVTPIDEAAIREAISRAPAADVYKAWKSYEQTGVDRGATPDESRVARLSRNRAAVAAGLSLIAGVAAVAAVGAGLAMALRRRAAGP